MSSKIIQGDNVRVLSGFPSNCIDLTVTSPPYDGLRTYNGYSFDFESLARHLYRVTKRGGVVVWVVGDGTQDGSETGTSFRQALFFMSCGFKIHDTIIYSKGFCPYHDKTRYMQTFEYMFVLSKDSAPKITNIINDRRNKSYGRIVSGTTRNPDGSAKPMVAPGKPIKEFGQRTNVWEIEPDKSSLRSQHPAIFPEKLAEDHILSWSNPGDVVLDPFCGSGTTGKMALVNLREFIGIEISSEYCKIASQRVWGLPVHVA